MKNTIELLTVKQVCEMLSISIATIYRWEAEGNLPFPKLKIGQSAVRFRAQDVYGYIEKCANDQLEPQREVA